MDKIGSILDKMGPEVPIVLKIAGDFNARTENLEDGLTMQVLIKKEYRYTEKHVGNIPYRISKVK